MGGQQRSDPGAAWRDPGSAPRLSRRASVRLVGMGLAGLALSGVLAACGSPSAQASASGGAVKFVNSGDAAAQARMAGYLAAFQKSAGVPVSLVSIENYYTSNIQAMVAAGVPPDVLYVSRTEYDALYPAKKLADLRPYLQRDAKGGGAFFPITLQEWQNNGQQLAIPLGFLTFGSAFANNLLRQVGLPLPPTSWSASGWNMSDFVNTAEKAAQPGTSSQDPVYGFYVDPTYLVWSAFVMNNGGTVVNEQNHTLEVDQPPAIDALTALQTVIRKPGIAPPNDLVSADGGIDLFANGNLAMTITDPSTIGSRQRQSHFVWDTGVLPAGPGGRFSMGTGAGYALLAGSKHADNGWKLIQYLTSAAVQQQEALIGQWIPSRPTVAGSAAFLPEINNVDLYPQHARVFVDALTENRVKLQPALPNWSAVLAALEAGIQGLWTGQLTPGAAAAQMKKLAEPLLRG